MENAITHPVKTDSNEVTQADIQAVELALRKIDKANMARQIIGSAANWVLVLRMFRDVELGYLSLSDRSPIKDKYRALVSGLMSFGDLLLITVNEHPALDFSGSGLTKNDLLCNVRYLREKYEQWFVETDISATAQALNDACAADECEASN